MKKEAQIDKYTSRFRKTIKILLWLIILSLILSIVITPFVGEIGNVALIKINNIITAEGGSDFFRSYLSADTIIKFLEDADQDENIKAIVLEINSPGGSAVASKQLAEKVKSLKKPTIALIKEIGTSGAYWVAASADIVVADQLSLVGSIGVISSYIDYVGFMQKYGFHYNRLVSGKYKDIGSPFKNLTEEERKILENKLKEIHELFIKSIAENRNLSYDFVKNISTGIFYLGLEAKKLGLVDYLGNKDTVKELLRKKYNITKISFKEYKIKRSLFDIIKEITNSFAFFLGQGINQEKVPVIRT